MSLEKFATKINGLPRQLRLVRVLEAFEGDLLVQYQAVTGSGFYVEKWCAGEGALNRFLLVRTELRFISEYMGKKLTLLQLLTNSSDGGGFIVDRKGDEVISVYAIRFDELPKKYMPDPTAMHEDELRPLWQTTELSFLLDETWDAYLMADIEKTCQNTFGFAYYTQPGQARKLPSTVMGYKYDGGYAMGNCFSRIRDQMPNGIKIKTSGVAAASPGILTLNSTTEIFAHISSTIRDLSQCAAEFKTVHKWSKTRSDLAATIPDTAFSELTSLCECLNVDVDSLFPEPTQTNTRPKENKVCILAAGKILASYYRRLWSLVRKDKGYDFVGFGVQAGNSSVIPEGATVEEEDAEENS